MFDKCKVDSLKNESIELDMGKIGPLARRYLKKAMNLFRKF
jgi:hypothetical protein